MTIASCSIDPEHSSELSPERSLPRHRFGMPSSKLWSAHLEVSVCLLLIPPTVRLSEVLTLCLILHLTFCLTLSLTLWEYSLSVSPSSSLPRSLPNSLFVSLTLQLDDIECLNPNFSLSLSFSFFENIRRISSWSDLILFTGLLRFSPLVSTFLWSSPLFSVPTLLRPPPLSFSLFRHPNVSKVSL